MNTADGRNHQAICHAATRIKKPLMKVSCRSDIGPTRKLEYALPDVPCDQSCSETQVVAHSVRADAVVIDAVPSAMKSIEGGLGEDATKDTYRSTVLIHNESTEWT